MGRNVLTRYPSALPGSGSVPRPTREPFCARLVFGQNASHLARVRTQWRIEARQPSTSVEPHVGYVVNTESAFADQSRNLVPRMKHLNDTNQIIPVESRRYHPPHHNGNPKLRRGQGVIGAYFSAAPILPLPAALVAEKSQTVHTTAKESRRLIQVTSRATLLAEQQRSSRKKSARQCGRE
jgi:hypothetical protein